MRVTCGGEGEGDAVGALRGHAGGLLRGCGVAVAWPASGVLTVRASGSALESGLVVGSRVRARPFSTRLAPWERARWERGMSPLDARGQVFEARLALPTEAGRAGLAAVWVELELHARSSPPGIGALTLEVLSCEGARVASRFEVYVEAPRVQLSVERGLAGTRGVTRPMRVRALALARALLSSGLARGEARVLRLEGLELEGACDRAPRGAIAAVRGGDDARGRWGRTRPASALHRAWLRGELRAIEFEWLRGDAMGDEEARRGPGDDGGAAAASREGLHALRVCLELRAERGDVRVRADAVIDADEAGDGRRGAFEQALARATLDREPVKTRVSWGAAPRLRTATRARCGDEEGSAAPSLDTPSATSGVRVRSRTQKPRQMPSD